MISLEQIRALETRVEKAVNLITSLKTENSQLRTHLDAAEFTVAELEEKVQLFQQDQLRIEEGIVQALKKLDFFEDSVQAVGEKLQASVAANANAAAKVASTISLSELSSEEQTESSTVDVEPDMFNEDVEDSSATDSSQLF